MRPIVLCAVWGTISCASSNAQTPTFENESVQKRTCHQDGSHARPDWTQHQSSWIYKGSIFAVGVAENRDAALGRTSAQMKARSELDRRLETLVAQQTTSVRATKGRERASHFRRHSFSFTSGSNIVVQTRCVWTDGLWEWAALVEHRLKDRNLTTAAPAVGR